MKKIFFEVVGIKIKIILTINPGNGADPLSAKKSFEKLLKSYLGSFESKKKFNRPDFIIHISSSTDIPATDFLKIEGTSVYTMVLKDVSERKIHTFYQIGIYQFHYIFHKAIENILSQHHGFGIHSSAILRNGSVDLFLGKSGAGKSTISSMLSQEFTKLTDDLSFVRKKNSHYYYYDAPEIDKDWKDRKTSFYNIKNVYFLRKSSFFKVKKLNNDEALALLLKSIQIVNRESITDLISFIEKINSFSYFYFTKDKYQLLKFYEGLP